MKCLITGGAGFIGSHIQDKLIQLGHTVAIVDNLRSGKKENLNPKATFFEVDIRDKDKLNNVFSKFNPEVVFHLAAQNEVPYSMDHPEEDLDINIRGMLNLLECCRVYNTKKVIYSNTGGALYGEVDEKDLPVPEDFNLNHPTSYYGVSKGCAERYLMLYGQIHNLSWVSLRYANVYGPRQEGNREAGIIAIFTYKMLHGEVPTINGNGQHTRDYIFVGDVVAANVAALSFDKNDYFNISTGRRISNVQVFKEIDKHLQSKMTPKFGPNRPGDPLHNCLSPKKAKKLLNWSSKVSFSEGVKKTVDYYLSFRA